MSYSKHYDEIIKKYADAAGKVNASGIADLNEKAYVQQVLEAQKKVDNAYTAANRSAVQARGVGQVSSELEKADILWKKVQKYQPVMMKQAGLGGLGVAQSAMLKEQDNYMKNMSAARQARDSRTGAALEGIWQSYRDYVSGLDSELDTEKQKMWSGKLGDAKTSIDEIYGDVGTTVAEKQTKLDELLLGFADNAELQKSLAEYAKGYADTAKAYDALRGYYVTPTVATAGEAIPSAFSYDGVDFDKLAEAYKNLSGEGQIAFDKYLEEVRGVESIGDRLSSIAKTDQDVEKMLELFGNDGDGLTVEEYKKVLADFTGMSSEMRENVERDLALTEYASAEDKARTIKNNKELLKAAAESIKELDIPTLSEEEADALLEEYKSYLNEDGTVNEDVITQEIWDKYAAATYDKLTDRKGAYDAYRDEVKRLDNATYQAQMAGDEPIKGANGEKMRVAKSPDGDIQAFMRRNRELVNEALGEHGEYGDYNNPDIPDKTMITIDAADLDTDYNVVLMYDKTSGEWKYLIPELTSKALKSEKGYFYVNGEMKKFSRVETNSKALEAIRSLDLGNDVPDGKTVTVSADGRSRKCVSFGGHWYYLE